MPSIVGTRETRQMGNSYSKHPLYAYAKALKECNDSIINESGFSVFEEPNRVYRGAASQEAMRRFYLENCYDENDPTLTVEDKEEIVQSYRELFQNDIEAMNEHAVLPEYNPIVGMALPIHKLILMNMVFDKGAIQKVTAVAPSSRLHLRDVSLLHLLVKRSICSSTRTR